MFCLHFLSLPVKYPFPLWRLFFILVFHPAQIPCEHCVPVSGVLICKWNKKFILWNMAPLGGVEVLGVHTVGVWRWKDIPHDLHCVICDNAFELPCAQCDAPGDACPPAFGSCGHIFHLHCIGTCALLTCAHLSSCTYTTRAMFRYTCSESNRICCACLFRIIFTEDYFDLVGVCTWMHTYVEFSFASKGLCRAAAASALQTILSGSYATN